MKKLVCSKCFIVKIGFISPTKIIKIINNKKIDEEIIYGMKIDEIAEKLMNKGCVETPVYIKNADVKEIVKLKEYGLNINTYKKIIENDGKISMQ